MLLFMLHYLIIASLKSHYLIITCLKLHYLIIAWLRLHYLIITCLSLHYLIIACLSLQYLIITCLKLHYLIITCLKIGFFDYYFLENTDIRSNIVDATRYAYQETELDAFAFTKYYLEMFEGMKVVHPSEAYEKVVEKYIEVNKGVLLRKFKVKKKC